MKRRKIMAIFASSNHCNNGSKNSAGNDEAETEVVDLRSDDEEEGVEYDRLLDRDKKRDNRVNKVDPDPMEFSFGIISDTQYVDDEDGSNYNKSVIRRYRHSLEVLKQSVVHFEEEIKMATVVASGTEIEYSKHKFNIQLGDIIDAKSKSLGESQHRCLDTVLRATAQSSVPWHFCLGNHDFSVFSRDELAEKLLPPEMKRRGEKCDSGGGRAAAASVATSVAVIDSMSGDEGTCCKEKLYYSFCPSSGFRIIVLDAYDVSILNPSHPSYVDLSHTQYLHVNPNVKVPGSNYFSNLHYKLWRYCPFNGAISDTQLSWLQDTLSRARNADERCFVFCHIPIKPEASDDTCLLWNCETVLEILKSSKCVVAYIAGHNHAGGYARDNAGIHHITPPAPLECEVGQMAYGAMRVYQDRCELQWTGKGSTWLPKVLKFRKKTSIGAGVSSSNSCCNRRSGRVVGLSK